MKSTICTLLAALLCFTVFTACGKSDDAQPSSSSQSSIVSVSEKAGALEQQTAPAAQEAETYSLDFTLYNYSNAALTDIRISITADDSFGENLLPSGYVLRDGGNSDIVFNTTAPAGTTFDMYTMDSDGDSYEYYDIPLTKITTLALYVEVYTDGSYNNFYEYD